MSDGPAEKMIAAALAQMGKTKDSFEKSKTISPPQEQKIAAPTHRLTEVKGISEKVAQDLKLLQAAATKLSQESVLGRPILSSWSALLDYCRSAMQFEPVEQFRVLFLDRKNRLIADEVLGRGTVDRAPVYPREIIKRCLALEATAIILAHNHPSGDPTPSQSDIHMTKEIQKSASGVNVVVSLHVA